MHHSEFLVPAAALIRQDAQMGDLPRGTVTFLFSDVEGSTRLLEEHGARTGVALARHHEIFEEVVEAQGGAIFETVGDAVYAAFADPRAAAAAALDAHRRLAAEDWGPLGRIAVRIALHTGQVEERGAHYFGSALFRAARLLAIAHGEQTLLSGVTAGLARDALPEGATLRDLGIHRLKDLGDPEHVYQLVQRGLRLDFPPLRDLDARPHNLPVQLSSFVGRERELDMLANLLANERLLTVLGPGGIGKTRLVLQAAADGLDRFPDGSWFVDLAPLRDPDLLPAATAAALGLQEQPGVPVSSTVAEFLRPRKLLLVLDNLEQLLPDASSVIAEWVRTAPELHVLTTSRAPLRLRGEREFAVPPLSSGNLHHPDREPAPAVTLFLERGRAVRPDLEVTPQTGPLLAAITDRLDGLPLAIELAAARLRVFSLAELDRRLARRLSVLAAGARDMPARQQTLSATIAWSHDLLAPAEQDLFARLGVFSGTFTAEAVDAVATPESEPIALDGLETLLEQSLVGRIEVDGESRYAMLETIREYAAERLEQSGTSTEVRDHHAAFLIGVVTEASRHFRGQDGPRWLDRVEHWHADIRSALTWLDQRDNIDGLSQLVAACAPYWRPRGQATEALRWLDRVISDPRSRAHATAVALRNASVLRLDSGESSVALDHIMRSVELFESERDEAALADALMSLGNQQLALGRQAAAEASLRRAVDLGTKHQVPGTRLDALGNLALLALARDRLDESLELSQAVLAEAEQAGYLLSVALSAGNIASILVDFDRPDEAIVAAEAAVAAMRELKDVRNLAWALNNLGHALLRAGQPEAAAEKLIEGMRLTEESGGLWNLIPLLTTWAELALVRSEPSRAVECLAVADQCTLDLEYQGSPIEVRASDRVAAEARLCLQPDRFARLWASAAEIDPYDLARRIRSSEPAASR